MATAATPSVAERLLVVRQAYEQKDYQRCREELAGIQASDPAEPEVHRWLARLAYRDSDWPAVAENASAYLESSPDDREIVKFRARACNNLKQWPEAARTWAHLTELQPDWPEGWYQLARAQMKAGQSWQALTFVAGRLRALGANDPQALLLAARFAVESDRVSVARDCYAELAATHSAQLGEELAGFEKRQNLQGIAAVLSAAPGIEGAAEKSKAVLELLIRRAISEERESDLENACVDYATAALVMPDDALAQRSVARVLQKLHSVALEQANRQEMVEAVRTYEQILRCSSADQRAASQRARLLTQQHQWASAADAWRLVCEITPDSLPARIQFARAVERAELFDQAESAWRAVQKSEPGNEEAQTSLLRLPGRMLKAGKLAFSEKRFLDAYELFSRIPANCPEREDAGPRLEKLARQLRKEMRLDFKEARYLNVVRRSAAAMELMPEDAEVHKLIAKSAGRSSGYALAARAWSRFVELEPEAEDSHYLEWARCCLHIGEYTEGNAAIAKVLQRDPQNEKALELQLDFRESMFSIKTDDLACGSG